MPLPKGTLLLQNPNAGPLQTPPKLAMLVRLPAEAYAALEHAAEIQIVNDGLHPSIKIGNKSYPLQHQPETHPHELVLQVRTPGRNNPPLKSHAAIVHKMVPPTTQRSDASSAYARAAAAAEAPRKSTGILDSIPTTLSINGPSKAAPKKAKQPAVSATAAAKARKVPGSTAGSAAARSRAGGSGGSGPLNLVGRNEGLSASAPRASPRPSTPVVNNKPPVTSGRASPMPPPPAPIPRSRLASSTSSRPSAEPTSAEKGEIVLARMDPAEREAWRMRMVHEVAKGAHKPRSREDLRVSLQKIDWNAFKSLLAEVAEPNPPTRSILDKDTTWGLKPRVWRDVRPYSAPPDLLTPKEANLIAEYADGQFDKQGLPLDHPAREAVRPRQPGSNYAPSPPTHLNAGRSPNYHTTGGGISGGVPVSSKPGASGSTLPPKPPGLPPKPVGMPLPPINSSATATRQRMSPMPPPPVTCTRRESPAESVASTPKRRTEPDSEREEGEMDEDEPPRAVAVKKVGGGKDREREMERSDREKDIPDAKRRRVEARARQEDGTPRPPSPSVLKKSAKRARDEEPDAAPRRPGREREREEALAPPKKKVAVKREPSPLPPPPPATQATKKKISRERERGRDISPPPARRRILTSPEISRKPREREKEREREETPNTAARRKRGREVDFTSDEDSDVPLPRKISGGAKGKARESERESERERFRDREPAPRKIAPIPRKVAAVASGTSTPTSAVRPGLKEKDRTASGASVKERIALSSKESSGKGAVKHEDRDRDRDRERPVQSKPKPKPQPAVKHESSPDLEDGEEPSSSSSSDTRPSKSKFTPSDLGPLPSTEDALRSRLRTAYKYYYDAHSRCEDQKEAIIRALAQGDHEGGEGKGERRGTRLLSEKTVLEMYGEYEAWRDEVIRVKAAAEGSGVSVMDGTAA